MSGNPWGEQVNKPVKLESIISQQSTERDEDVAKLLHRRLNGVEGSCRASATGDLGDGREQLHPPECGATASTDELLARKLQQQYLQEDHPETINDALLAAMLQDQWDNEVIAEEDHIAGSSKVRVSQFTELARKPEVDEIPDDVEDEFYYIPNPEESPHKTKHDKENTSLRHRKKMCDTFNLEFPTGDVSDIQVPHRVYNQLRVNAHKSKFNGVRVKDRQDISSHEQVLDSKTRVLLLKMVNSGMISKINGPISTGKESVIIHCLASKLPDSDIPVPLECVLKIHKTSLNEFSRRRDYIDSRYAGYLNSRTKKLIEIWSMKEVHNLNRLRRKGIMCPEVIGHRKQIILMSFIGNNGIAAPTLHDTPFSSDQLKSAYQQLLTGMKTMFSECKLVHADLSPYNLLWHNSCLHFIDLSQAVLTDHPSALTYLYRDCCNMTKFFKSRNLKNVLESKKMFLEISNLEVDYTDEISFITKIEHLQRQDVRDFKHGTATTDYAFEACFNAALPASSSGEEDDEDEEEEEEREGDEEEVEEKTEAGAEEKHDDGDGDSHD